MTATALQHHAQRYREARNKLYAKIAEEFDKGKSMIEIAAAVGLSRQRVHQIIKAQEMSVAAREIINGKKEEKITGDKENA